MSYVLPVLILALLISAFMRRTDVYEAFTRGAAEALPLLLKILPFMAAMLAAMSALRASGALDAVIGLIAPAFSLIGMPAELLPLFLLRPFSGSAAMALLQDVFANYGTDTFLGFAASLMLGSTETIFYTIALYFGSVGVKRTRHTVPAALIAGVVGAACSVAWAFFSL